MIKTIKTIICSVVLVATINSLAYAKEFSTVTVDKNKKFTITFNKNIDWMTVNPSTIKVFDSEGKEVDVIVSASEYNKKIAMVRPRNEYKEGETYSLKISGVKDSNNENLKEETTMKFKIKDHESPKEENKSEDEIFFENLYKTNSPYWDQGAKFVDGKLNLWSYDYETKKVSWNTLSTNFNPDINRQTIDVFKALYIEKEGYRTEISYGVGNSNTGLSEIMLYGKNLTVRGEAFVDFMFFDSSKSTSNNTKFIIAIPQCTNESYNNNSYIIKNALGSIIDKNYSEQIFDYISNQYKNTVLAGNYERIDISKTFGKWKVIVHSYNKSLYAEIIEI